MQAFLQAGVMEERRKRTLVAGTPQGACLSPLLSNAFLNTFDHQMPRTVIARSDSATTSSLCAGPARKPRRPWRRSTGFREDNWGSGGTRRRHRWCTSRRASSSRGFASGRTRDYTGRQEADPVRGATRQSSLDDAAQTTAADPRARGPDDPPGWPPGDDSQGWHSTRPGSALWRGLEAGAAQADGLNVLALRPRAHGAAPRGAIFGDSFRGPTIGPSVTM